MIKFYYVIESSWNFFFFIKYASWILTLPVCTSIIIIAIIMVIAKYHQAISTEGNMSASKTKGIRLEN